MSLTLQRVIAGFGQRVRCCAMPSLQVATRLLNVAPRNFGFDCAANFCRPVYPILREGGTDLAAKAPAAQLAKVAGAAQHQAMLDQLPRRRRNPIAVPKYS